MMKNHFLRFVLIFAFLPATWVVVGKNVQTYDSLHSLWPQDWYMYDEWVQPPAPPSKTVLPRLPAGVDDPLPNEKPFDDVPPTEPPDDGPPGEPTDPPKPPDPTDEKPPSEKKPTEKPPTKKKPTATPKPPTLPSSGATATLTPTPTLTATLTSTPTLTSTALPSSTSTASFTPTSTSTSTPTGTATPEPTLLPVTPTATPRISLSVNFRDPLIWLGVIISGSMAALVTGAGPYLRQFTTRRSAFSVIMPVAQSSGISAAATGGTVILPTFFAMEGGRIIITGPAKSGKTTVMHNLLQRALVDPSFTTRILLDGKNNELEPYSRLPGVTYRGVGEVDDWLALLHPIANDLPLRYQQMIAGGKRKADPGSARVLIVVDGLEYAARDPKYGSELTEVLLLIAARPEALADVLILTIQSDGPQASTPFHADAVITLQSAENPGAFTLQSSPTGPVEAEGQARYIDGHDAAEAISTISQ